jgi:hypothetical protein
MLSQAKKKLQADAMGGVITDVANIKQNYTSRNEVQKTYATKVDLVSNYSTKKEIQAANYATKRDLAAYQQKGDYATRKEIQAANYASKTDLTGYQVKGDYALKSELANYQPAGNYATRKDIQAANYATKGDLAGYAAKTDLTGFQPKGDYAAKADLTAFQPKGDYALKSDIAGLNPKVDLSGYQPKGDYAAKSDLAAFQPKGDYAVKGDLAAFQPKGDYALKSDITGLNPKVDLSGYQPKGDYAVKGDLVAFQPKGDYVVKSDLAALSSYATKEDLKKYRELGFPMDFALGAGDNSRGDTGPSRALVKDNDGVLAINYANDFKGGVRVDSNLNIKGAVNVVSGQPITIRDQYHGIQFAEDVDGPSVYGYQGGKLRAAGNARGETAKDSLIWHREGVKVPGNLEIGGNVTVGGKPINSGSATGPLKISDRWVLQDEGGVAVLRDVTETAKGKDSRFAFFGSKYVDVDNQAAATAVEKQTISDTRDKNFTPEQYYQKGRGTYREFKASNKIDLPSSKPWSHLETIVNWNDPSGGPIYQYAHSSDTERYVRVSEGTDAWQPEQWKNAKWGSWKSMSTSDASGAASIDFDAFTNGNDAQFSKGWKVGGDWPWDPVIRGPGRGGWAHTENKDDMGPDWQDNDTRNRTADITVPAGMKSGFLFHLPWYSCRHFDIWGVLANGKEVFIRRVNAYQNVKNTSTDNFHDAAAVVPIPRVDRFGAIRIRGVRGRIHYMGTGWTKNNLDSYASGADSGFLSSQNIVGQNLILGTDSSEHRDYAGWTGVNMRRRDGQWTHFDWKDDQKNYIRGETVVDGVTHFNQGVNLNNAVNVAGNINVGDNVVMTGNNSWILHTPNDGRKQMYIAPGTDGGNWDWGKQTQFMADGTVVFSNPIVSKNDGFRHIIQNRAGDDKLRHSLEADQNVLQVATFDDAGNWNGKHPLKIHRTIPHVDNYNDNKGSYALNAWGVKDGGWGVVFKNGPDRDDDGGRKAMTVRNDDGDLRLMASNGVVKINNNLSVNDDGNGLTIKAIGGGNLNVQGNVNVGGKLSLPSGQPITIRDDYHGMKWIENNDGPFVHGWGGGALGTRQDVNNNIVEKTALSWKPDSIKVHNETVDTEGSMCIKYGPNKKYSFCLQGDGNVVQYKDGAGAVWATGKHGN